MVRTGRRIGTALTALLAGLAAAPAAAEPQSLRLGALELGYDDAQWAARPLGPEEVGLLPVGPTADKRDPVRLVRGSGDCPALAARYLPADLYEPPVESRDQFAGQTAVRYEARTRCRNATPLAALLCLPVGADALALVATVPSCRSSSNRLFQSDEPFAGLSARIRFGE